MRAVGARPRGATVDRTLADGSQCDGVPATRANETSAAMKMSGQAKGREAAGLYIAISPPY